MTKMDYSRGYSRLKTASELPKATPISDSQRKALFAQKNQLRKQHLEVNQDPVIKHASHTATVKTGYGKSVLWCCECDCSITDLTQDEYKIWQELNPPKILVYSHKNLYTHK